MSVKLGKYLHNKTGGIYYALMIVIYTGNGIDSDASYMVYCNEKGDVFTRPADEFVEKTKYGIRFKYLGVDEFLDKRLLACNKITENK